MSRKLATRPSSAPSSLFSRDPIAALRHEVEDLFGRFQSNLENNGDLMIPSLDLEETDVDFEVRMDVPGFKADQIDIQVSNNQLVISGHREEKQEEKNKTCHRIERQSGSFSRSISLPSPIKEDKVKAECEDGVLTITLPKVEVAPKNRIKIKAK